MKRSIAIAVLALAGFAANAVPLANDMTCAQAQDYYRAHGRVWVETRMGDVVPIYGDRMPCSYGEERTPVWVRTLDTNTCTVAYRCRDRDNGN